MNALAKICSVVFGYLLLGLSLVVVAETMGRKFLGFSLQGADELGGYVLAVASTLGFTAALIDRGHIRIDILRRFQSRVVEASLDWVAALLMLCFASMLAWACIQVVIETVNYQSVAPSPWGTPLIYPQSIWLVCMVLFFAVALWLTIDATVLLVRRRFAELIRRHGPKGLEEELAEELENIGSPAMNTIAWGSALLIALLLLGIPVAVVMVTVGIVGGIVAFGPVFIDNIGSVVWSTQNENLLTAIPLFILLGEILLRSGLADRMYTSLAVWLDRLPGGLLHTNIGACALFAATCGSSAATAATVGTVAIPNLVKRGYPVRPSLGSLAAGGTLGILIPPSVALLVYGSLTNTSVGQLFIAGIVPGLLLTLSFVLLVIAQSFVGGWKRPESGPSLPFLERLKSLRHLMPVFFVFAVVMGGLYFGWATPTEAAALGVFVALVIAKVFGRLTLARLHECFRHTAVLTGMMILILVGAFVLNVTLSLSGIPQRITDWMVAFGVTPSQLVLCMVALYLVLGCFLDVLSMQVTTIPIAFPIVTHFGIDPLWFGIFVTLMSEVAMITPPVGLNLFVIQSIRTDGGDIRDVIVGSAPYVTVMLLFVAMLWYAPQIVLWLPRTML